jgi:hypothetical protein
MVVNAVSPQRHRGTEGHREKSSFFEDRVRISKLLSVLMAGITERKSREEFRTFERAECFHRGAAALAEERRVIILGDRVTRSGTLEMAEIGPAVSCTQTQLFRGSVRVELAGIQKLEIRNQKLEIERAKPYGSTDHVRLSLPDIG